MASLFIAAGGTGGHIYPGLALAEALVRERSDLKIYFVGTKGGLENQLVPNKGFPVLHLPIGRLNSNVPLRERLKTLFLLPFSFVKAVMWLRKYKPACVIGIGGHASGPMLLMAAFLRYPAVIWEPNAMPGLANRWLAPFVDLACVVFEESKRFLKAKKFLLVGMPLRREIEKLHSEDFSPVESPQRTRVLVFGGSQGARGINNTVQEMLIKDPRLLEQFEVVHQTGQADFERIRAGYKDLSLDVRSYINDMPDVYRWADIIISRSGASTLAELAAVGKPSILIPFPFAADNHQYKNAQVFSEGKAAVLLPQKDLTASKLKATLLELKSQPERRLTMGKNVRKFFRPEAAQSLGDEILKLAQI